MKQRRPTRRKHFRQPRKRLYPVPPPPSTDVAALPPRVSNAVLDPVGTPDGPLTLRAAANFKGEGGFQADPTVVRAASHKAMLSWIEVLEALIAELPTQRRGIGHNLQLISDDELGSITKCVIILKHQPVVPTAPDDARAAGSTLKKIGERLGTYLDACLLEASKSAGKELGKRLAQLPYWLALWYALNNVVQSVSAWLH
jgi:hypothetical protein